MRRGPDARVDMLPLSPFFLFSLINLFITENEKWKKCKHSDKRQLILLHGMCHLLSLPLVYVQHALGAT